MREEEREKGDKEDVQGNILNKMMMVAREGSKDMQKKKTPTRRNRKEEKRKKEEASLSGVENMRMMLKTWTKGGRKSVVVEEKTVENRKTIENEKTVGEHVEVVGLQRDLCTGGGVEERKKKDQKPVIEAGHAGGVGGGGEVGERITGKKRIARNYQLLSWQGRSSPKQNVRMNSRYGRLKGRRGSWRMIQRKLTRSRR